MLIIPRVTEMISYQFDFIDPAVINNNVRDSIQIYNKSANKVILGYQIDEWTDIAQLEGITGRRIEKKLCFPDANCAEKKVGTSSKKNISDNEKGSTSGKIQRNKGRFSGL